MVLRLGDLLMSRGLITREQLNDGLFAQQQFGGRLGTNLVELGFVSDDQLALCLSEQLGVPYARSEALSSVPRDAIAKMPRAIAEKYRAVPLRYQNGELHTAMADPQNFANLDELTFAVGCRVRAYVVTEVALNYALERYYSIRRETRLMMQAAGGMREIRSTMQALAAPPPGQPVLTPPPMGGLPVFDPALDQAVSVVEELAAVMTEDDVVKVLFRYFTELFVDAIILTVVGGRVTQARAGNRLRAVQPRHPLALSMAEGTLLQAVISKPQIIHQNQVVDVEVARLCASYGIATTNIAFLSLFYGDAPAYAIIGQGRDERYLQQAFSGLRGFVGKTAHALRIVALRNEIRAA